MSDQPPAPPKPPGIQLQIDDVTAQGLYTNLVMINHSENEFVLDFAYLQPSSPAAKVRARIISSPRHTKRLLLGAAEERATLRGALRHHRDLRRRADDALSGVALAAGGVCASYVTARFEELDRAGDGVEAHARAVRHCAVARAVADGRAGDERHAAAGPAARRCTASASGALPSFSAQPTKSPTTTPASRSSAPDSSQLRQLAIDAIGPLAHLLEQAARRRRATAPTACRTRRDTISRLPPTSRPSRRDPAGERAQPRQRRRRRRRLGEREQRRGILGRQLAELRDHRRVQRRRRRRAPPTHAAPSRRRSRRWAWARARRPPRRAARRMRISP